MSSSPSAAIDPGPFLINTFGDRYLYSVNKNIFNKEGAAFLYRQNYKELFAEKDHLHIILGSDGGLLINYCLQQERPKGSRYIFVELQEIIDILDPAIKEELPNAIRLYSFDDFWQQGENFQLDNYLSAQRTRLHLSFAVQDAHILEYRNFQSQFETKLHTERRKQIVNLQTAPFIEEMITNLCDNRQPVKVLKNCFCAKTAIILGGGPSMDDILPWLKKNRNKVIIFAVSRICKQLLQEGIAPHIIVTIDPQEVSFKLAREMFFLEENSLLINFYHAANSIVSQWGGISAYIGNRFPWNSPLNSENDLPSAGSTVTNMALELSVFMGCSQIILGGVDFCLSRQGISHASGSNEYQAGPRLTNVVPIKTNSGEIADTRPDYYQAWQEMGNQVERIIANGIQIINPSPYSAKIEGVDFIPLDDISINTQQDPLQVIRSLLPQETPETRRNEYSLLKKELEKTSKDLVKMNKLFKEALLCNAKLSKKGKIQAQIRAKKRMDQIEEHLKNNFTDLFTFLRIYTIVTLFQAVTERTEEESWSNDEANEFMRRYYKACLIGSKKILSLLENVLNTVEMRLEEEKKTPDIKRLVLFWQERKRQGRARVWKKQHNKQWHELDERDQQLLTETEEIFTDSLKADDPEFLQQYKNASQLTGIPATALNYFQFRDEKALARLAKGLQHHPDKINAEKFLFFVNALQYELKDDTSAALAHYHSLIEEDVDTLTELVLRRIFILCLNLKQYDDAFLAAECLTGISIINAPFLAKLHELGGDKPKALEIYTLYLEKVGLDISIMNKMAKIYLDLGIEEGAELMYNNILKQDSENNTAQNFFAKKQKGGHNCG